MKLFRADHARRRLSRCSLFAMDVLFKTLGVLLACYVARALWTGSVYARWRAWGRAFERADDALGYWGAIGSYVLLSLALVFLF